MERFVGCRSEQSHVVVFGDGVKTWEENISRFGGIGTLHTHLHCVNCGKAPNWQFWRENYEQPTYLCDEDYRLPFVKEVSS